MGESIGRKGISFSEAEAIGLPMRAAMSAQHSAHIYLTNQTMVQGEAVM